MRLQIQLQEGRAFLPFEKQAALCQISNCLFVGPCSVSSSPLVHAVSVGHAPRATECEGHRTAARLFSCLLPTNSRDECKQAYSTKYTLTETYFIASLSHARESTVS